MNITWARYLEICLILLNAYRRIFFLIFVVLYFYLC